MTQTILVIDPLPASTAKRLRGLLPEGYTLSHPETREEAELHALAASADYIIAGQAPAPEALLRAAPRCKLLHKWGVGVDNLDLDAARALGIKVARTTGSNAVPVAEFTIGLMIAAMRNLAQTHAALQQGNWGGIGGRPALGLSGKTVGIVGMGAIGTTVAKLLRGFDCTLLYTKPTPLPPEQEQALGVRHTPLADLLAQSDVVSLHCPLTPQTEGMIDAAALRSMKRTAILINVARGGVVVEADLVQALADRTIQAAAMDVFAEEPLPADSPLLGLPGLITTPHIAAQSSENFATTVGRMFANIQHVARGEPLPPGDVVVP